MCCLPGQPVGSVRRCRELARKGDWRFWAVTGRFAALLGQLDGGAGTAHGVAVDLLDRGHANAPWMIAASSWAASTC